MIRREATPSLFIIRGAMNSLTPEIYDSLLNMANPEDFEIFGISLDESAPRENITANQWREYDELIG